MNPTIQVVAVVGSIAVMLIVFEFIRRRKLREEYSFLWFGASLVLMVLSVWRELLHEVARWVGVEYPPSVLLLGAIVLGFLLALHFSISLTRLAEQNKRLAQEVALLRHRLERAAERPAPPPLPVGTDPAGNAPISDGSGHPVMATGVEGSRS